jgi:threonine synthase
MSSSSENNNDDDGDMKSFVTHLECSYTGRRYKANVLHNLSEAGKPLLVKYDLEAAKNSFRKESLQTRRPPSLWRYRELLPIRHAKNIVSLGEVMTPLLPCEKLQTTLKSASILIKDEGRLPTGSFKARGLALAVSMAKELGVVRMAMPTNGNAGAALAAYCSKAGNMESFCFCPNDTPQININEMTFLGAHTFLVNGLIHDCGRIVKEGKNAWFDVSTLKEPYRIEGKKTMGLELAEQLEWSLPDVIIYPTGGGTGLIGMWKAFQELEAIGWIDGKRPRMVAVQSQGCAPIVKAFQEGTRHAALWEDAKYTIAAGIRVPVAVGDFLILDAIRESGGFAVAVSDEAILEAQQQCAREEGILLCPEGAATLAALKQELQSGRIQRDEQVVLFNCASGLKYPMQSDTSVQTIDIGQPIDYEWIKSFSSGHKD